MTQAMTNDELSEIRDRLEIQELMHRYAEMVDRRDWKQMDRVFALEATIDYTSTGGHAGPFRETLAWLDRALESWPINLHLISNLIIEFDSGKDRKIASARCYFHAPMARESGESGQYIITNAGYYVDRVVRTQDGWRILERVCHQILMQGSLPDGYKIPD
jgi:3-phenylpropionate/cinnamic acid dioxygenase small subunit